MLKKFSSEWCLQISAGVQVSLILIWTLFPSGLALGNTGPNWWFNGESPVILGLPETDNYLVANVGQAKHMALQAAIAIEDSELSDEILAELVPGVFSLPQAGDDLSENYKPLQLGQLMAIAKPFYDHLNEDPDWVKLQLDHYEVDAFPSTAQDSTLWGYTFPGWYPWNPANTKSPSNLSLANLGQLKAVFALELGNLPDNWSTIDPTLDDNNNDIPDYWEALYSSGYDDDGLTLAEEFQYGTDPTKSDTDQDGISDSDEILLGLDPLNAHQNGEHYDEGDLLPVGVQVGDPILDGNADFDGDGLGVEEELLAGTDPQNNDTDSDGIPDGWEVEWGLEPSNPADAEEDFDLDYLSNFDEYESATSPTGFWDLAEIPLDPAVPDNAELVDSWGTIEEGAIHFLLYAPSPSGAQTFHVKVIENGGSLVPTFTRIRGQGGLPHFQPLGLVEGEPSGKIVGNRLRASGAVGNGTIIDVQSETETPSSEVIALSPNGKVSLSVSSSDINSLDVVESGQILYSGIPRYSLNHVYSFTHQVYLESLEWVGVTDDGSLLAISPNTYDNGIGSRYPALLSVEYDGYDTNYEVHPFLTEDESNAVLVPWYTFDIASTFSNHGAVFALQLFVFDSNEIDEFSYKSFNFSSELSERTKENNILSFGDGLALAESESGAQIIYGENSAASDFGP